MTETLTSALVEMREDDVLAAVRAATEAGTAPADVIAALQAGMKTIGDKYEAGEYFLSELIMSAEIFKRALEELGLDKSAADTGTRGTVVLGTVHTDIHDIGKNIVASVLSANGFKVVDLGVDVPAQAVRRRGPRQRRQGGRPLLPAHDRLPGDAGDHRGLRRRRASR